MRTLKRPPVSEIETRIISILRRDLIVGTAPSPDDPGRLPREYPAVQIVDEFRRTINRAHSILVKPVEKTPIFRAVSHPA